RTLATQMARALKTVAETKAMDPEAKMQYITNVGDYILEQVATESMEMMGRPSQGMAVLATGGFGRSETMPSSDLDFGVVGHDEDIGLIREITTLMASKVNLARGILAEQLGLPVGMKAGFEADPLWLQSPTSVEPERVAQSSASKGTVEDARAIKTFAGTERDGSDLIPRFGVARGAVRDSDVALEALGMAAEQYAPPGAVSINQQYNIKEPWLRLMGMTFQKLATYFTLHATNTKGRIAELGMMGHLDDKTAEELTAAFDILASIRQSLHSHYKGEKDDFFSGPHEAPEGVYKLSGEQFKAFSTANGILNTFHAQLAVFMRSGGKTFKEEKKKEEKKKTFFGLF
ncbi:MAG: hypothetical protein H0T73_07655, partial [Ardenticatenales bacterium]|nr:hypothetical protein [Ardenticatenales bacterium]